MYVKRLLFITLSVCTAVFLMTACSDSSTGPDLEEDAPEFPEVSPYQMDTGYYESANVDYSEEYSAFHFAAGYAQTMDALFSSLSMVSEFYRSILMQANPDYSNGEWSWTESYAEGGEEFSMTLTMSEAPNGYHWEIRVSGDAFEDGETYENFLLMDGFESSDQTTGEWNLYQPESGSYPIASYEYQAQSENQYELWFSIWNFEDDASGQLEAEFHYERNDYEHWLNFDYYELEQASNVYWNEQTGTGYYEQDGERHCWDETYQNAECS